MAGPDLNYSGPSRGHSIAAVDASRPAITLEDGSVWLAYEGYVDVVRGWGVGEMITVKENRDELFPYKLVNVHHNQSVEVQLVSTGD
jgi:precorrin-3B methylase